MEKENNIIPIEDSLRKIFRIAWISRPKKSFITGFWLRSYEGTPLIFNLFAHVLAKGQNKYPYFRLYLKNIVLLTPGEHALYDNGTEEARILYSKEVEAASGGINKADWGKLEALADELKAEYKKYFPSHKGLLIGIKYSPEEVHEIVTKLNTKFLEDTKYDLTLKKENPDESN
jgi:hypothetical protein